MEDADTDGTDDTEDSDDTDDAEYSDDPDNQGGQRKHANKKPPYRMTIQQEKAWAVFTRAVKARRTLAKLTMMATEAPRPVGRRGSSQEGQARRGEDEDEPSIHDVLPRIP